MLAGTLKGTKKDEEAGRPEPEICGVPRRRLGDGESPQPDFNKVCTWADPRFVLKYIGLCKIRKRIGKVTYRLELPEWWKQHNVFHVSCLKPYHGTEEDVKRCRSQRPYVTFGKIKQQVPEAILNHRVAPIKKRQIMEYLVKWEGCTEEDNTWKRAKENLKALIAEYLASQGAGVVANSGGGEC